MNVQHERFPAAVTRLFAIVTADAGTQGGYWDIDSDSPLIITQTLNGRKTPIYGGGRAIQSQLIAKIIECLIS